MCQKPEWLPQSEQRATLEKFIPAHEAHRYLYTHSHEHMYTVSSGHSEGPPKGLTRTAGFFKEWDLGIERWLHSL